MIWRPSSQPTFTGRILSLNIPRAASNLPSLPTGAIPLVDRADPDAHEVALQHHDRFPEVNGVSAAAAPPGTEGRCAAELRVGRWEEGLNAHWHSVRARALVSDITPHAGIAMDGRNAGERQGTFHLQISNHKGKNLPRSYGLRAGHCWKSRDESTLLSKPETNTIGAPEVDAVSGEFVVRNPRPRKAYSSQHSPMVVAQQNRVSVCSSIHFFLTEEKRRQQVALAAPFLFIVIGIPLFCLDLDFPWFHLLQFWQCEGQHTVAELGSYLLSVYCVT